MGNALIITGLVAGDGNRRPNVVELYAVKDDNANGYNILLSTDLTPISIGCCFNNPNTIKEGEFYTVTDDATAFKSYFGVDATFTSPVITNAFATVGSPAGERVFKIFARATGTSDEFGNSTTTSWFYSGGWAYRND